MRLNYLALAFTLLLGGNARPATLYLAGDSTMAIKQENKRPETGWGERLQQFFDSTRLRVDNRALNGRSTKSFITEGRWGAIFENLRRGDWVFIQFAHNDEIPTKATYTTPEQFKTNLRHMVADVRAKRANPVLLTPVARRMFGYAGNPVDTHRGYVELVREVAQSEHVPLLDLHTATLRLLAQYGPDSSTKLFLQLAPGVNPNYPNGVQDNTHFSTLGAQLVAERAVQAIRDARLPIATFLR